MKVYVFNCSSAKGFESKKPGDVVPPGWFDNEYLAKAIEKGYVVEDPQAPTEPAETTPVSVEPETQSEDPKEIVPEAPEAPQGPTEPAKGIRKR